MASAKKLPSGNWRARGYTVDKDGKRHFKSFTSPSKKEAEALAAQYTADGIEKQTSALTLRQATEKYIESKRNILSPATIVGYKVVLDNYVPKLFAAKVSDLDQSFIQTCINELAADHSPKTCRNTHGLISAVLKLERPELILRTTLPQKKKSEIYVPDKAEIAKIFGLCKGTVNEVPVFLAAECGLRASEIAALRKDNVFPDHIRIEEAAVMGDDGQAHTKAPKSVSGYRDVPISEEAYHYLVDNCEGELICPRKNRDISSNWSAFRKYNELNEHLNFHALRHHFASKCILLGIPQKYIAEMMGHGSTDMIERVYQHVFPSAMEKYSAAVRDDMNLLLEK